MRWWWSRQRLQLQSNPFDQLWTHRIRQSRPRVGFYLDNPIGIFGQGRQRGENLVARRTQWAQMLQVHVVEIDQDRPCAEEAPHTVSTDTTLLSKQSQGSPYVHTSIVRKKMLRKEQKKIWQK